MTARSGDCRGEWAVRATRRRESSYTLAVLAIDLTVWNERADGEILAAERLHRLVRIFLRLPVPATPPHPSDISTAPTRMDGCLHALACIRMPQHCAATLNGLRPVGGRWRARARARARTHARTHTRRRRGGGARERASGEHKGALVRKARPKAMAYPAESLEPLALQQVACLRPFVLFRRRVRPHRFDLVERTSKQTNKQAHSDDTERQGLLGSARTFANETRSPGADVVDFSLNVHGPGTDVAGEARVCGWIRRHYLCQNNSGAPRAQDLDRPQFGRTLRGYSKGCLESTVPRSRASNASSPLPSWRTGSNSSCFPVTHAVRSPIRPTSQQRIRCAASLCGCMQCHAQRCKRLVLSYSIHPQRIDGTRSARAPRQPR